MDLSIFASPEAWISLVSLIFLEIVLGVDNLVFISITTNRLPEDKQHIGRKLGLAGALVMRIIFLCFASFLVHMTAPLFTIDLGPYAHGFSVRDLVLLVGGGYLIYKGIAELRDTLKLTELKAEHCEEHKALHRIALPQAVGTIMVMDLVFSIDSVITAVGMADHLMQAAEQLARESGAHAIRVDTHRHNGAQKKLLERHGYRFCGNILCDEPGHDPRRQAFEKLLR